MRRRTVTKVEDYKQFSDALHGSAREGDGCSHSKAGLLRPGDWERDRDQRYHDLVALVKCGVPVILRTVVWSNFMKTPQL
jgi:hypothetical protein